jgi:regulatory protein YycI of two-component signal transduction system YycFG
MIFVFVVLVGLIFIVYVLYNIVITSTNTEGLTPQTTSTSFDQDTIKRINELKSRDQSGSEIDFAQGRSNPFVE